MEIMREMMSEMKIEMNEKLAKTEGELAATKNDLAMTKNDLAITKNNLATNKAKTDQLEKEVAILRAPPFLHSCGSNTNSISITNQTIPYISLLYSSTNTEGGGLDINTGVFTAPWGGSYTVYWNTRSYLDPGQYVIIWLQRNGVNIYESLHYSSYHGTNWVHEQGGRSLVVYLGIGDTLQLYSDDGTGHIAFTTFCVSLSTFDIV